MSASLIDQLQAQAELILWGEKTQWQLFVDVRKTTRDLEHPPLFFSTVADSFF